MKKKKKVSKKSTKILTSLLVLVLLGVLFVKFRGDLNTQDESFASTSTAEKTSGLKNDAAAGLPDFIQPPGSNVISSSTQGAGDETTYQIVIMLPMSGAREVIEWYETEMGQSADYSDFVIDENEIKVNQDSYSYTYTIDSVHSYENGEDTRIILDITPVMD